MHTPLHTCDVRDVPIGLEHRADVGRRAVLLLGIMLLCVLVRAAAAWSYDTISADGAYFIRAARAIQAGDLKLAFAHRGFNLYPLILVELNSLGLSYELAAKIWGVAAATLTLLPLWGMFRRQFGEQIGACAAFLYAVHPGLIEWSVDPIRDSTFWFLFSSALYCSVRAMRSAAWPWFVSAGAAIAAATLTRTEGWLLLIPLAAAAVAAFRSGKVRKRGWALGLAAAVLCIGLPQIRPAVSREEDVGQVRQTASTIDFVITSYRGTSAHGSTEATPAAPEVTPSTLPFLKRAGNYAKRFCGAFHPVVGLLCLWGLARHYRLLFSFEQGSIAVMNGALLILIWLYLRRYGDMNTRYFYPIVICALPFAAYGLLRLCERVSSAWRRPWVERACLPLALILLTFLGAGAALAANHDGRRNEAAVGKWIAANCGENLIVAEFGGYYLPAHYAQASQLVTLTYPPSGRTASEIKSFPPEVVILRGKPDQLAACREFMQSRPDFNFTPVSLDAVLDAGASFAVYRIRRPTVVEPD